MFNSKTSGLTNCQLLGFILSLTILTAPTLNAADTAASKALKAYTKCLDKGIDKATKSHKAASQVNIS